MKLKLKLLIIYIALSMLFCANVLAENAYPPIEDIAGSWQTSDGTSITIGEYSETSGWFIASFSQPELQRITGGAALPSSQFISGTSWQFYDYSQGSAHARYKDYDGGLDLRAYYTDQNSKITIDITGVIAVYSGGDLNSSNAYSYYPYRFTLQKDNPNYTGAVPSTNNNTANNNNSGNSNAQKAAAAVLAAGTLAVSSILLKRSQNLAKMKGKDGKEYIWYKPVADTATEPFWCPVEVYDDDMRHKQQGHIFQDNMWHASQKDADDMQAWRERARDYTQEKYQQKLKQQQEAKQQQEQDKLTYDSYLKGEDVNIDNMNLDPDLKKAADEVREENLGTINESKIPQLKEKMQQILKEKNDEGYFVRNPNGIKKVMWNLPYVSKNIEKLMGYKGGQCGEFAEYGIKWSDEYLKDIVGKDAVTSIIVLEKYIYDNPLRNHASTVIIMGNGERYVLDYWESIKTGVPSISKESEWIAKWKDHMWGGDCRIYERGPLEMQLKTSMEKLGQAKEEQIFDLFRKQAAKDGKSSQAEVIIKSWRKNPW